MFRAYFLGSSEGLLFDVPDDDYRPLLGAVAAYLAGLGVELRLGDRLTASRGGRLGPGHAGFGGEISAAAVVVATMHF